MNLATDLTYPAPLRPQSTWDVLDATKINAFQRCPRYFFYEYLLGWRSNEPNLNLIFGSAWHEALEIFYRAGNFDKDTIDLAYDTLMLTYRKTYDAEDDERNAPKNPGMAYKALNIYAKHFRGEDAVALFVEVPGTVPILPDRLIHFKIDTIMQGPDGIFNREHKTAGVDSNAYRAQWHTAIQPKIYNHALVCHYGLDKVFGTKVSVTFFRKTKPIEIIEIPCRETPDMMEDWLWGMQHKVREVEANHQALSQCSPDDLIMEAFPKRETSCTMFNRPCAYLPFCTAWANPLQRCEHPPPGMVEEHWDPRAREEGVDTVFKDGKIQDVPKEAEA